MNIKEFSLEELVLKLSSMGSPEMPQCEDSLEHDFLMSYVMATDVDEFDLAYALEDVLDFLDTHLSSCGKTYYLSDKFCSHKSKKAMHFI